MSTVSEMLALALDHHRAGRLTHAAALYQQVLAAQPRHAEAMHLLGVIAHQSGRHDDAARLIGAAIAIDAEQPSYYVNLGQACRAAGRLSDAEHWLQEAIRREPDAPDAHYNLALVHAAQRRPADVRNHCQQVLALQPNHLEAAHLLSQAQWMLGELDEAAALLKRVVAAHPHDARLKLDLVDVLVQKKDFAAAEALLDELARTLPDSVEIVVQQGDVKSRQGDWPAAVARYQHALALDPHCAIAECHWGMVLQAQHDFDAARDRYARALALAPGDVEARLQMAWVSILLDDNETAVEQYEYVLEQDPTNQSALLHYVSVCRQRGWFDRALRQLDRSLARAPGDAMTHFARGMVLLNRGDFLAGWPEYRWRSALFPPPPGALPLPEWDGAPREGLRLLVHGEQGRGDDLQFVRYLPLVRQRVPTARLMVRDALLPLLRQSGFENLQGKQEPLGTFDARISLADLPALFATTEETIPADIPYLFADETHVEAWRRRLAGIEGFRIGIGWQGNPQHSNDNFRSYPLEALAPLARVPGVRLISLQKGDGTEQIETLAGLFEVVKLGEDFDTHTGAFVDTAAVMRVVDLVVAPDSALAHLAGALGVAVWVAHTTRSDWRWLHEREDSPWYPTMRLFRQRKLGDWDELFTRMADALARHMAAQSRG